MPETMPGCEDSAGNNAGQSARNFDSHAADEEGRYASEKFSSSLAGRAAFLGGEMDENISAEAQSGESG